MVNNDLILKSIEYAINKCKKPSYSIISLSNTVKHTMNQFLKDMQNETVEHSIAINGKGEIIAQSKGGNDYVEVPLKEVSEYITKEVETELQEYKKELDYYRDNNIQFDLNELHTRHGQIIADKINELGLQVNLDHNHPSPYGEDNVNLGSPIFTTLSPDDMFIFFNNNIDFRIGNDKYGYFFMNNLIKSMSCECSNGSRMTLVNKNRTTLQGENNIDRNRFGEYSEHLLDKWYEYKDNAEVSMKNYQSTLVEKYKGYTGDDLIDKLREDTNNHITQESKKEIPNVIKDSISDFNKIGVELRVDWIN